MNCNRCHPNAGAPLSFCFLRPQSILWVTAKGANPFLSMQSDHPSSYCSTTQKSMHAQPTPSVVLGLRTRHAQQTWQQWCWQRNQQCQLLEFQSSERQQLTRDPYGAAFVLPRSLCLPREDLAAQTISITGACTIFSVMRLLTYAKAKTLPFHACIVYACHSGRSLP